MVKEWREELKQVEAFIRRVREFHREHGYDGQSRYANLVQMRGFRALLDTECEINEERVECLLPQLVDLPARASFTRREMADVEALLAEDHVAYLARMQARDEVREERERAQLWEMLQVAAERGFAEEASRHAERWGFDPTLLRALPVKAD